MKTSIEIIILILFLVLAISCNSQENGEIISRFVPLDVMSSLEVAKDETGFLHVYSIANGIRNLVFSKEYINSYQVLNNNCLYVIDESIPNSIFVRDRVFLILGSEGEVIDLGIHRNAIMFNNHVAFEKYEGEYTDEKMNIEFYSISKKRFESTLSLTSEPPRVNRSAGYVSPAPTARPSFSS